MLRSLIVLLLLLIVGPARAMDISLLRVEGGIDPAVQEYIHAGLRLADERRDALVILQMDTPGGTMTAMESIVQDILASRTPVCVYVAPPGARATSAGAIIALAANVIAMAPATNMGAATPIEGITGQDLGRKIKNDTAARARALAALRGRPTEWAQRVVMRAESITVDEAMKQRLADVKATDIGDLVHQLDGRKVNGTPLALSAARVVPVDMSFRLGALHLLANANVAYILMLIAIYGLIAELSHPGAIFPGVAGSIAALMAFYALSVLTVNVTGLLLILLAVGLFVGDVVISAHGSLAFGGVIAFLMGSLMLIESPLGRVSPYLAVSATGVTVAFFAFLITIVIHTRRRPAAVGREAIVGRTGVARTALSTEQTGQILFDGSLWAVIASEPIAPGQKVQITDIDGLTLYVRPWHS